MLKAIGSKEDLTQFDDNSEKSYVSCIADIVDLEEVQKLKEFEQHCHTSRFQHCLNVSYYSYVVCRVFGLDYCSAARGGLLHDLFLYNWRNTPTPQNHILYHPKVALENADKLCELNKKEKDIIAKHMWPIAIGFPKYAESYVISCVDKYCACVEILAYLGHYTKERGKNVLEFVFG